MLGVFNQHKRKRPRYKQTPNPKASQHGLANARKRTNILLKRNTKNNIQQQKLHKPSKATASGVPIRNPLTRHLPQPRRRMRS